MKTFKTYSLILFIFLGITSCNSNRATNEKIAAVDSTTSNFIPNPSGFEIFRGINISHWLSQTRNWSKRDRFFTVNDMELIKSLGYDHIRLPIDEEEVFYEDGSLMDSSIQDIHNAIHWALERDMRVIVDLHILRSHHFNARNNEGAMTLWVDTNAQNTFIRLWDTLSVQLKQYPNNMLAYEFMNEPVAPEHELWNKLINRVISNIRKTEPNRVLMLGSNRWQKPHTFPYLDVPKGDKNIILTVHNYAPYFVTHHKAYWSPAARYAGPINYPGVTISREDYDMYVDTTDIALVDRIKEEHGREYFDKQKMQEILQPAIDKAKELGLQLYCSEFGCLPSVERNMRIQYYNDITSVFRENNIMWCNWDYKGDFGVVGWDRDKMVTLKPDTVITHILTN